MFILEMRIAQVPIDFALEKIYAELQDDFPTMSLATVCRNVILLESLGEVLELGFPDGSNRYDGNKPYPHPHVICVECKKVIDPDLASLKDMAAEVADETGFKILPTDSIFLASVAIASPATLPDQNETQYFLSCY